MRHPVPVRREALMPWEVSPRVLTKLPCSDPVAGGMISRCPLNATAGFCEAFWDSAGGKVVVEASSL